MDAADQEHEDIDHRLDEIRNKAGDLLERCHFRSAYRLYGEMRRLSKNEQRVITYLHSVFHQMDLALDVLEPQSTREFSIELISLLESEERARLIQPDFPEPEYEQTVAWMTACAYENLAEATGRMEGYNSEGMHGCITDGIQVCRRTGKLACIRCFREYATEVYTSADDVDMALHHTRSIATHLGPWSNRGNRRWLGSKNEAWLLLLSGHVEAAESALRRAAAQAGEKEVSLPLQARLRSAVELQAVLLLAGKLDAAQLDSAGLAAERVPAEEFVANHIRWELGCALAACCRGDFKQALDVLGHWDRWLNEHHCTYEWFEVRLRLLAAMLLSGAREKVRPLAEQLHTRATKARDWLTLRRIQRLFDGILPPDPLALLGPVSVGPFAMKPAAGLTPPPSTADDTPADSPVPDVQQPETPAASAPAATPLEGVFQGLAGRLEQAEDDAARDAILRDLLAIPPSSVTEPYNAFRFLHLAQYLVGDGQHAAEVWTWAEALAAPHVQIAPVLNLLAVLGDIVRQVVGKKQPDLVAEQRIEALFRQSLDLDPHNAHNYARAGAYYLARENLGEAERCLARGFRLARDNSFLALRLADVYRRTERPRDGLAVLDMCLREGSNDPDVAWNAALSAFNLGQHDTLLTYLDRFEVLAPGKPWTNHYRALALLKLGKAEEALTALDEEERRNINQVFHVLVLRSCALADLGQIERLREQLRVVLGVPLRTVTSLTVTGLVNLFARLGKSATALSEEEPLRQELERLVLAAGLAPDETLESVRRREEKVRGVRLYRCLVEQPLDAKWPQSQGCLAGQEGWKAYRIPWGVLARDEAEAERFALAWQARCYWLPAKVLALEADDDEYFDRPGAVWQGLRVGDDTW